MAAVIDFADRAVASLRARVAAVEEDNRDLVAFARGHAGAVNAIHRAALDLIDAATVADLAGVVTQSWPGLLGIDAVALIARGPAASIHAHGLGFRIVEPRLVDRIAAPLAPVTLRDVPHGHPLFGEAAARIRAEALVRFELGEVSGVLGLGQAEPQGLDGSAGAALLGFLGDVIARMMARCTRPR